MTRLQLKFWLGDRLGCDKLDGQWYVMRPGARFGAKPVIMTVPYFEKWAAKYKKAMSKEIIKEDELEAVTNKGMYSEWLKLEPEPGVVLVEVDKPWSTIWDRVSSGLVGSDAFTAVYLLAHNRLGTRERGFRLMPELILLGPRPK